MFIISIKEKQPDFINIKVVANVVTVVSVAQSYVVTRLYRFITVVMQVQR